MGASAGDRVTEPHCNQGRDENLRFLGMDGTTSVHTQTVLSGLGFGGWVMSLLFVCLKHIKLGGKRCGEETGQKEMEVDLIKAHFMHVLNSLYKIKYLLS